MAAGENSVKRASRLMVELDAEIEFLRGMAIDATKHIDELQAQIDTLQEELDKEFENREQICDQKMDALYTKQALMLFIRSGGGLDMYV